MNKSFFSSREIYVRLTELYRKKMAEYSPYTIMRWCSEVVADFIKDPSGTIEKTVDLGKPVNNMLLLPAGVFKIDKVITTSTNTLVPFSHQGDYLLFSEDYKNTEISCVYQSFVIDDEGFPMIKRGYEKACESFCVYQLYREDFMDGKIDGLRWGDINNTKDWEIEAAARAWDEMDENEVSDIHKAMVNPAYKAYR